MKKRKLNRINEVKKGDPTIYGPPVGICLCPPPWTPCGCLGHAMSLGVAPEDMDPRDFRGNDGEEGEVMMDIENIRESKLKNMVRRVMVEQFEGVDKIEAAFNPLYWRDNTTEEQRNLGSGLIDEWELRLIVDEIHSAEGMIDFDEEKIFDLYEGFGKGPKTIIQASQLADYFKQRTGENFREFLTTGMKAPIDPFKTDVTIDTLYDIIETMPWGDDELYEPSPELVQLDKESEAHRLFLSLCSPDEFDDDRNDKCSYVWEDIHEEVYAQIERGEEPGAALERIMNKLVPDLDAAVEEIDLDAMRKAGTTMGATMSMMEPRGEEIRESDLRRLIKKVLIQEQSPTINSLCDYCKYWYMFNPGSVQDECMCTTCPCGSNPQTGPNTTNCQMCKAWYTFAPGSVVDNCECPSCPCSEGKKIPTTDKQWHGGFEVDTDMGYTSDTEYAPDTKMKHPRISRFEKELSRYTLSERLNEQGTPGNSCIDPNSITYNTPQGVACLCFFDMTWSQGHQYGGHVEIEGCMQPNSNSTLSIYVNDNLRASTSGLNPGNIPGSFGTNIVWGNANTPIIRVKAVMECTGSHPSCSAENIEKTICVRRSDGQKVPCRKTMPKGELIKHDDSKATAINYGGPTIDSDLESRDDAEDIRESDLVRLTKKVISEQNWSWTCETGGVAGTPCQCVPDITGWSPGPSYVTLADCQADVTTCCGGDVLPQEWCCAGGVTGQGQCIQVPGGTCNQGNMGTGYAGGPFPTQQACQANCGGTGTPDRYECVNNSCTAISPSDPGYSNAPFQTMDDCLDSMCGERRPPIDDPRGTKADMPIDNSYAKKGSSDMERARARALSESDLIRLIKKSIR